MLMLSQEYLLKWPKTVLVVSHAREFLNAVCTDIVYLHNQSLTPYKYADLPALSCMCNKKSNLAPHMR